MASPEVLRRQELLTASEVVALLGRPGLSKWYDLDRRGLVPAPVELDGCRYWRRRELSVWVDAGCPSRDSWEYRPTVAVRLDRFIDEQKRLSARLSEEIRELETRLERGERVVTVERDFHESR